MKECPECGHIIKQLKYGTYDTLVQGFHPVAWECSKCGWDSEEVQVIPKAQPLNDIQELLNGYLERLKHRPNWFKTPLKLGTKVMWTPEFGSPMERLVCPDCVDHPQRSISDVHDCKNEFTVPIIKNGMTMYKTVEQCNCSSNAHGVRDHDRFKRRKR